MLICAHSWPFLDLLLLFTQFHRFIDSLVSEMTAQVCSVASLILKHGIFLSMHMIFVGYKITAILSNFGTCLKKLRTFSRGF